MCWGCVGKLPPALGPTPQFSTKSKSPYNTQIKNMEGGKSGGLALFHIVRTVRQHQNVGYVGRFGSIVGSMLVDVLSLKAAPVGHK